MNDLRVTDAFGLNEILQSRFNRWSIERFERASTAANFLRSPGRFHRHADPLVESRLVIHQLVCGREERGVVENVSGDFDAVCSSLHDFSQFFLKESRLLKIRPGHGDLFIERLRFMYRS